MGGQHSNIVSFYFYSGFRPHAKNFNRSNSAYEKAALLSFAVKPLRIDVLVQALHCCAKDIFYRRVDKLCLPGSTCLGFLLMH